MTETVSKALAAWKLNSQYVVFISLIFIFCDIRH